MGWKLNSKGGLTVAQRQQADALEISHAKYRDIILQRLRDYEKIIPPVDRNLEIKKNVIKSNNPVLVVGAGPSYRKYLKEVKNFPGKVIVMDINFNTCCEAGIIPDYIATMEEGIKNVKTDMFLPENLKSCKKTVVIGSSITRKNIETYIIKNGTQFLRWKTDEEPRISNCGLFSVNFAYEELKADKIFLVGFEHTGHNYSGHTVRMWQVDFLHFIQRWPKETIVNCTDGGVLYYYDYIVDSTLDNLQIIKND